MKLLEKLIWVAGALIVALLVIIMVYWKPSPIPTGAIEFEETTTASAPANKTSDFSAPSNKSSGRSGAPSRIAKSSGKGSSVASASEKLKYPVKAKNPQIKSFKGPREFREKYGNNYREVWEAMQKAEAELIEKPDGSKLVKIISIEPGSVIDKLMFEVGDEIYSVNGRNFSEFKGSVGELYNLGKDWHGQLRNETEFQIELNRNGTPVVLNYHIPK